MSRVFLAHELALGRLVAIKVLSPDLAAGVSGDRFRREILLLAKLQHPHIVPVHTVGEVSGLPYFTMPFIEGESLRTRISREGELPLPESLRLLRDVVAALAYAHGQGVIHRDVKPDNVLLSAGSAVVADFGVAKAIFDSAAAAHSTTLTSTGMALGTPAYMAPEQAVGDANMDHRVDLYAFGILAYEMLTGRPPFTGRSAQATLAAHVTEAPEPVHHLRPNMPSSLAALIMRCLEKHAADRPDRALDIMHSLDAMATPSGGSATTTATLIRAPASAPMAASEGAVARNRSSSSRIALIAAAGVAVAGITLLAILVPRARAPEPTPRSVAPPAAGLEVSSDSAISNPMRDPEPEPTPGATPRRTQVQTQVPTQVRGPAPVMTPDTVIASRLRTAALEARSTAVGAGTARLSLGTGDSLLRGGDSLRRAGRYTEAGMAYSAARAAWAGAATAANAPPPATESNPPAATPAPVSMPPADPRPAIAARLAAYAAAIESESTAKIQQAYPTLTTSQEHDWSQFFDAVNQIKVTLAMTALQVRGDSADAVASGEYTYENGSTGRAERQPVAIRLRLARAPDGSWIIVGIR